MSNDSIVQFRPFDNVETNWICSICFDIVERTKLYNRIVRHCCRLWQKSRMLLRQSRTLLRQCCLLLRHCCWCGRGLIYTSVRLRASRSIPNLIDRRPSVTSQWSHIGWRVMQQTTVVGVDASFLSGYLFSKPRFFICLQEQLRHYQQIYCIPDSTTGLNWR